MNKTAREILGLIIFVIFCFAAARIGAAFTTTEIGGWYAALEKPSWNPPNWVFGPVWAFLYLTMALAAWLVWRRRGLRAASLPLTVFFIQLAFNVLWSVLFFGLQSPGWAFAEILLLCCAILATTVLFWKISPAAGWLLLPYLCWVSFAALLNLAIWRMNA